MYEEKFQRNELYWNKDFQNYLKEKYIAVIGLGGVGGFALEALVRLGISNFLIADFDTISYSNINRQIIALDSTVGMKKTEAFKKRLLDINPDIKLKIVDEFIEEEDLPLIFEEKPDFIVDAIDTVKSKVVLLKYAKENKIETVSSFGAGNRIDASKLYVCDISKIEYKDNFQKNLLLKLKKYANIEEGIWTVVSLERAKNTKKVKNIEKVVKKDGTTLEFTKFTPASNSIVPAVAGYLAANKILEILYNKFNQNKV